MNGGAGEIGSVVSGNDTRNSIDGNTQVADGGKGVVVDGNNSNITNNGNCLVSGEDAVGPEINGDNASLIQRGGAFIMLPGPLWGQITAVATPVSE